MPAERPLDARSTADVTVRHRVLPYQAPQPMRLARGHTGNMAAY